MLSVRREKILKAVIDDYITTAAPVSSGEICERHFPELSSATIRNELAALEDLGFLTQPHTSAGRVPTAAGYKLYVDKLMPKAKLKSNELKTIKKYFDRQVVEIEDVLKKTAKVISEVTNLTGVAFSGNVEDAVIESIKLVKLSDELALIVIVTDKGVLKDASVKTEKSITEENFLVASGLVTGAFKGRPISDIITRSDSIVKEVRDEYRLFFDIVLKVLSHYSHSGSVDDLVLEGSSKILEQPEYSNISKAKAILSIFDAREQLIPLLKSSGDVSFNVQIGTAGDEVDCAVVTAKYSVGGTPIGSAGVIGPMRMDYAKVISVLDYVGKTLSQLPPSAVREDSHRHCDAPGKELKGENQDG